METNIKQNKPISLREFIYEQVDKMGIDKFKSQFGVTEGCVNHWRRSMVLPRAEHMALIVKLSGGRVTYEAMIKAFLKKQRAKKKQSISA